jgi:GNAT superfamily N-acetyltransferase/GTPase SAR1 family protein
MSTFATQFDCNSGDSVRVAEVAGMFGLVPAERCRAVVGEKLPSLEENWRIGLVVGPSASGKTSLVREVYTEYLAPSDPWPDDRAVIDSAGNLPTEKLVDLFTSVGFGSPPAWVRPYNTLSGGEQFRCDVVREIARAEVNQLPLVVIDEFTSTLDRLAAWTASAALAKGIRNGRIAPRLVAVTCHNDVTEWLAPDWVCELPSGESRWRRLRRPTIDIEVRRTDRTAWPRFAPHHYLSGSLSPLAECYLATWQEEPVAFAATLPVIGRKHHRRFTRIVTLPAYQGIGIGSRLVECVAELHHQRGHRVTLTTSHPAMIAHCEGSPRWKCTRVRKTPRTSSQFGRFASYRDSGSRVAVSFAYVVSHTPTPH